MSEQNFARSTLKTPTTPGLLSMRIGADPKVVPKRWVGGKASAGNTVGTSVAPALGLLQAVTLEESFRVGNACAPLGRPRQVLQVSECEGRLPKQRRSGGQLFAVNSGGEPGRPTLAILSGGQLRRSNPWATSSCPLWRSTRPSTPGANELGHNPLL